MHSDRRIAIAIDQPEKFSLRTQAGQGFGMIDRLDQTLRVFVIPAQLQGDDPLPARGQKIFGREDLPRAYHRLVQELQ